MVTTRLNEIDLLRFMAALAVMIFHYAFRGHAGDALTVMHYDLLTPAAHYGYIGINLFFLISGFVILMSAQENALRPFIISRIVRLYPAFWLCCTLTFLSIQFLGSTIYHASVWQYLANMTMAGNYLHAAPMDGVYWSLYVEFHFYAMIAVFLYFRKIDHALYGLLGWLLAIVMYDCFLSKHFTRTTMLVEYGPLFIGGASLYLIRLRGLTPAWLGLLIASWALAVFHACLRSVLVGQAYHVDYNLWIISMLITSFFVALFLIATNRTGGFSRLTWRNLGNMTYPVYLLHQFIGFIIFNALYGKINTHLLFWGTILSMLLMAWLVHTYLERPVAPRLKVWLQRHLPESANPAVAL